MQDELLTAKEVADELRNSEETVRRLMREGKLKGARKIGGQWRIPSSSLRLITHAFEAEPTVSRTA